MQRWPFPIHNGILESFACSSMNYLLMLLFLYWCISIVFLEAVEKLIEIYTFRIRKTTLSFTFLIRFRFQGYHWKSNIAIFVWRVTWNYTYSPFFSSDPPNTTHPKGKWIEFKDFNRSGIFKLWSVQLKEIFTSFSRLHLLNKIKKVKYYVNF